MKDEKDKSKEELEGELIAYQMKAHSKLTTQLLEDAAALSDNMESQEFLTTIGELASRPPFINLRADHAALAERVHIMEMKMADHKHSGDGSACMPLYND